MVRHIHFFLFPISIKQLFSRFDISSSPNFYAAIIGINLMCYRRIVVVIQHIKYWHKSINCIDSNLFISPIIKCSCEQNNKRSRHSLPQSNHRLSHRLRRRLSPRQKWNQRRVFFLPLRLAQPRLEHSRPDDGIQQLPRSPHLIAQIPAFSETQASLQHVLNLIVRPEKDVFLPVPSPLPWEGVEVGSKPGRLPPPIGRLLLCEVFLGEKSSETDGESPRTRFFDDGLKGFAAVGIVPYVFGGDACLAWDTEDEVVFGEGGGGKGAVTTGSTSAGGGCEGDRGVNVGCGECRVEPV
mmetsp:Transcript_13736/g.16177  ORF Transcript_13736/g.16177 Transcript_13736/m.16177 type:complete len:296 (-) Transcript_13736:127-1014(-)